MLSRSVIDTDSFKSITHAGQTLYMHLIMNADDDGMIGNVLSLQKSISAKRTTLGELVRHGYLYVFESGVAVILHWGMHNRVQPSKKKKTVYTKELGMLQLGSDNCYYLRSELPSPMPQNAGVGEDRRGEGSVGQERIGQGSVGQERVGQGSAGQESAGSSAASAANGDGTSDQRQNDRHATPTDQAQDDRSATPTDQRQDDRSVTPTDQPQYNYATPTDRGKYRASHMPPTEEELLAYAMEHELWYVNLQRFFENFSRKGWRTSSGKYVDWQRRLQEWDNQDRANSGARPLRGPDSQPKQEGSFDVDDFFEAALRRAQDPDLFLDDAPPAPASDLPPDLPSDLPFGLSPDGFSTRSPDTGTAG